MFYNRDRNVFSQLVSIPSRLLCNESGTGDQDSADWPQFDGNDEQNASLLFVMTSQRRVLWGEKGNHIAGLMQAKKLFS